MGPGDYGMDGIVRLAYVGLIAIAVLAIAAAVGLPIGIWWLVHHIAFV